MSVYQRLTPGQRYQIELLISKKLGVREVARQLKVSPSTISREIARCGGKYSAEKAQLSCRYGEARRASARFKIQGELKELVEKGLKREFSPEQISATLKRDERIEPSLWTIYRYIERDKEAGGRLKYKLRILRKKRKDRKRPKYRKCLGLIKDRVSIEKRPEVVERRSRLGDYERDTVLGKRGGPLFLTIVERKSGYVHIRQISQLNAKSVHRATVKALKNQHVKTITNDNGIEFAFHKDTAKALKTKIYFSRSYAAWERGSNENLNGLLRQYYPRKMAIPVLTSHQVRALQYRLNTRPRKRLGYKTPYELYHGKPPGRVLR